MNISLVFQHTFHAAYRAIVKRIGTCSELCMPSDTPTFTNVGASVPHPPPICARRTSNGNTFPRRISKPLRVVRVFESGQARSSVGRMVISGRMADVCAELDRLVAHEAAIH